MAQLLLIVILLAFACLGVAQQEEEANVLASSTEPTTNVTTHNDGTAETAENGPAASSSSFSEHSSEEDEKHVEPVYAVLMPWFVNAAGIVIYYLLTRIKYLRGLPYTCILFIMGVFMGSGSVRTGLQDQLTESIGLWRGIDHEVLFLGKHRSCFCDCLLAGRMFVVSHLFSNLHSFLAGSVVQGRSRY